MRYDTPIYFQSLTEGSYNADTGNYEGDTLTEVEAYASVMDTRMSTMMKVYGCITQGSYTLHMQNHYDGTFNTIRIGEKRYKVDYERKLRVKHTFVVSEVQ